MFILIFLLYFVEYLAIAERTLFEALSFNPFLEFFNPFICDVNTEAFLLYPWK